MAEGAKPRNQNDILNRVELLDEKFYIPVFPVTGGEFGGTTISTLPNETAAIIVDETNEVYLAIKYMGSLSTISLGSIV